MEIYNPAAIVGNGESWKGYDLTQIKIRPVFGCNALYRDFAPGFEIPDYLIAIDEKVITEVEHSSFPSSRFIVPPAEETFEPIELHLRNGLQGPRPRSNTGMNAMLEAIKMGYDELHCIGLDFLAADPNLVMSNRYDGTECYELNTRATYQDARNRMKYLAWVVEKNPETSFVFYFPKGEQAYIPSTDNCRRENLDDIFDD